jgi:hypothetical protein
MSTTQTLSAAALSLVLVAFALPPDRSVAQPATASARHHGAPGPVLGAGLPGLAIGIGYGIYWLRKRRRRPE